MITLAPLNRWNWESCLNLDPGEENRVFVPDILFSIAQSRFEKSELFAIMHDQLPVGFIMFMESCNVCWISRIIIDRRWQRKGLGRQALALLLNKLRTKPSCHEIRTTVHKENISAQNLFEKAGFELIERDDIEWVMKLKK